MPYSSTSSSFVASAFVSPTILHSTTHCDPFDIFDPLVLYIIRYPALSASCAVGAQKLVCCLKSCATLTLEHACSVEIGGAATVSSESLFSLGVGFH